MFFAMFIRFAFPQHVPTRLTSNPCRPYMAFSLLSISRLTSPLSALSCNAVRSFIDAMVAMLMAENIGPISSFQRSGTLMALVDGLDGL